MRRKIGISLRVTEASGFKEERNSLAHDWTLFFNKLNIAPILIPNGLNDIENFLIEADVQGVILSGGNNVNPNLYNSSDGLSDVYDLRDRTESQIISSCINNKIPIIGVCRGMFMLNVFFGGRITHSISCHVASYHDVDFVDYIDILGNTINLNSFHNQAIEIGGLSKELICFGKSRDMFVEAFKHKDKEIFGIQWHPERDLDEEKTLNFISKIFTGDI